MEYKNLTLSEKVEKLNEICKGNLSFTHYADWTCNSYGEGTLLNTSERNGKEITGETFVEVVDKAFKYIESHKNIVIVDGKKYKLVEEEEKEEEF